MTYRVKYAVEATYKDRPKGMQGSKPREEFWGSEDRIIEHDRYYGYLKHKAQANFRKEEYNLTAEDWRELWPNDKWVNRGRKADNYSMARIDPSQPWSKHNVAVELRREYLKRGKEYRERNNARSRL